MTAPTYENALRLFSDKLDHIVAKDTLGTIPRPVKCLLLGGYALQALCRHYSQNIPRDTKDIDLYIPDARVLIGEDVSIGPTGARVQLTTDFHAELFDWISGMDHQRSLEDMLNAQMKDETQLLKVGENCKIYMLSPELFVANKLFCYRGKPDEREKDLRDVAKMISVLREKDIEALERVNTLIKSFGLDVEYQKALNANIGYA